MQHNEKEPVSEITECNQRVLAHIFLEKSLRYTSSKIKGILLSRKTRRVCTYMTRIVRFA